MSQFEGDYYGRTAYVSLTPVRYDHRVRIEAYVQELDEDAGSFTQLSLSPEQALAMAQELHNYAVSTMRQPDRRPPVTTITGTVSAMDESYWQGVLSPEEFNRIFRNA